MLASYFLETGEIRKKASTDAAWLIPMNRDDGRSDSNVGEKEPTQNGEALVDFRVNLGLF